MAAPARHPGIHVLGTDGPTGSAAALSAERSRAPSPLPAGCVLSQGNEHAIYFIHRTKPLPPDGSATGEVFGILAGIRRKSDGRAHFFDGQFNEVLHLASVADAWKAIIPDPKDVRNAAPAFDTTSFGNICAVRGGQTETWVIQNWTGEDHNFHVHQSRFTLDTGHLGDASGRYFQFPKGTGRDADARRTDELIQAIVAKQTGGAGGPPGWTDAHHDSVPVPRGEGACADRSSEQDCTDPKTHQPVARECSGDPTDGSCTRPGAVSIQVPFGRGTQVGEFVYHCHILEHEDLGMMARVRVVCPVGGASCGAGDDGHENGAVMSTTTAPESP